MLRSIRSTAALAVAGYLALFACHFATAAPQSVTLAVGESLTLALPDDDTRTIEMQVGVGHFFLEATEQFADIQLSVRDPSSGKTVILEGIDPGYSDITWVFQSDMQQSISITLAISARRSLSASAVLQLSAAEQTNDARYRAMLAESEISQLPKGATHPAISAAGAKAQKAASLWRHARQPAREARALVTASQLALDIDALDDVVRFATAAAELFKTQGDAYGEGMARNTLGLTYIRQRKGAQAERELTIAREKLGPMHNGIAVSPADSNLCFLKMRRGSLAQAEQCYIALLPIAAAAADFQRLLQFQINIGGTYAGRGQRLTAIAFFEKLLIAADQMGDKSTLARLLNNIASQYQGIGRTQEALNYYQRALTIQRELGDQAQIARILNNMGIAYGGLDVPKQAIRYLKEAHALRVANPDGSLEATTSNLAGVFVRLGEYERAFKLYEQALALNKSAGNALGLLINETDIALAYYKRGNNDEALGRLRNTVTKLRMLTEQPIELATALHYYGLALAKSGDTKVAEKTLTEASQLRQGIGDRLGMASTLSALGWVHWANGNRDKAFDTANQAIDLIETLRTDIANLDLRASYQTAVSDAYELSIHCLMASQDGNRSSQALERAERYRAQTLVDVLTKNDAADIAAVSPALRERRSTLRAQINSAEDRRLRGSDSEDISSIIAELNVLDDQIADQDPRFKATDRRSALGADDIRALMDDHTVALQYFLGRERSFVWLITRQSVRAYALPPASDIDALARKLHAALSRRSAYQEIAQALGQILLEPVHKQLANFDNIAIVADGSLHYLPFDALTLDTATVPLLTGKSVTYLPSLTTLALVRNARQATTHGGIAVLADPVFAATDERVTGEANNQFVHQRRGVDTTLNRLIMSGEEARVIQQLAGSRTLFLRTGAEARVEALQAKELQSAQILHIAAHGFVNDDLPARTGLALSMVNADGAPVTGFVGLRDIYELQLAAELVVLSACETALGRDLPGEGLLGLTRGFMYAGAERVIASLWQVEDRATAELMRLFYIGILTDRLPPATALAAAKQQMRKSRRWRHPYYWSGFVLLGDWQGLREINLPAATAGD